MARNSCYKQPVHTLAPDLSIFSLPVPQVFDFLVSPEATDHVHQYSEKIKTI